MKVGIIGTGNMGSILMEALIQSNIVAEANINVFNRTESKAQALKNKYNDIEVCPTLESIVTNSQLIFVCVKPADMHTLFLTINKWTAKTDCVISITSPISVQQMEAVLPCNAARFIPSITNKVLSGVSLITFGDRCSEEWKTIIRQIADAISEPIEIDNSITRVSSDIVSCGPAFFSYLAQVFIDASCKVTTIDQHTATILTEKMLIGFGELLKSGQYTLPTLQEKVCVKGGITGEGIKVLDNELGDVFEKLFKATHHKFHEEISKIENQFEKKY